MKKLILIVAIALPLVFNAQLMSENFDSYSDGDMLSNVGSSNGWGEWNGGTGTSESNTATSMFSFSGLNSGKAIGGNNGLWTWSDISEGTLKFSMQLYVPDGSNGSFVGLGDAAMSSQPNSINVLGDSLLFALDWGAQALIGSPVNIVSDSWVAIDFILDLDNQTAEFIVDGTSIGVGGTVFGAGLGFGGINFWGEALNPFTGTQLPAEYYFDDLAIVDLLAGIEEENGISMNISPNPSNGKFTISGTDMNFKRANIKIINSMGAVVYSKPLSLNENLDQSFNLDLTSGFYIVHISDNLNEFISRIIIE